MRATTRKWRCVVGSIPALALALAGWACGSDDEETKAAGSDAKTFYVQKVHASLATTCQECHQSGARGAPVFLGSNAEASYVAIEGFPGLISAPSVSPIVQKGPHSGPALTGIQNGLVTDWLKLEVTSRKLGSDPGVPKNLRAAFDAFGKCMDYARWTELKLNTIPLTTTENQGQCVSCHNYGQASTWLSANAGETFLKMRNFPYVQRLVVGRVNEEGAFDGIEASRRLRDKGTEAQQPQSNSHPRFSLASEIAGNLDTFVLETISNVAAGRCQNVTLPDAGPDGAAQQ
jgi:hypothetical protein